MIETSVVSYGSQAIHLLCKLMEWFLYDRDVRHERVKAPEKRFHHSMLYPSKTI